MHDIMVVVMGGGLLPNGSLPSHVIDRCEYVFQNFSDDSLILASSSFTLNVPPKLDSKGFVISEASAIYQWFKTKKFSSNVFCEQYSHDTVGGIFFSLHNFAEPFGYENITFVTSDFHSKRTQILANEINKIAFANKFNISVVGCPTNFDANDRENQELNSQNIFLNMFSKANSKSDFLRILFDQHTNYNSAFSSTNVLSTSLY